MPKIQLRAVEKRFDRVHAVKPVTLDIAEGEFLVLLGPSGCGKTTLLRMMAGLEEITAGDLMIEGRRVNNLNARARNVAMVFQNYALYPHMTVFGNLAFPLEAQKIPKSDIEARVREVAGTLGLSGMLDRKPKELSGGQRQRVAVGRAMVRNPSVFLFDEPLSNLDAKLREDMRAELIDLHRRLRNTVVYVTHDQIEAMTMAERIVVMRQGVIQQVATPREVYDSPANRFVAEFIGSPSMNLVPGVLDSSVLHVGEDSIRLAVPQGSASRKVLVGFRPTDVDLAPTGDDGLRLEVHVRSLQPLGHDVLLDLEAVRDGWTARAQVPWRGTRVAVDDRIRLQIAREALHLFDAGTGERIHAS